MPQYPTDSQSNMRSSRVESQRSEGSSSYPREQQRTSRHPIQTYSQSYTPGNQGTERRSGPTYPQTFTTGRGSTERPPGQTYTQSPDPRSHVLDRHIVQTYSQTRTSEGQSIVTQSPQPPTPEIYTSHYVKPKHTQTPKKYSKGEEVSIRGEYDTEGRPVYRRLRICCIQWSTTKKEWEYRVKDLQGVTIGWYTERELEKMAS